MGDKYITIPEVGTFHPGQRLTDSHAAEIWERISDQVVKPYNQRADHLNAQLARVLELTRVLPDKQLRQALGDTIGDDISGTWAWMRGLVAPVDDVEPIPHMNEVNQIVAAVCNAIMRFYRDGDSADLRTLADRYGKIHELPEVAKLKPAGRPKGTKGLASWSETLRQRWEAIEKEHPGITAAGVRQMLIGQVADLKPDVKTIENGKLRPHTRGDYRMKPDSTDDDRRIFNSLMTQHAQKTPDDYRYKHIIRRLEK